MMPSLRHPEGPGLWQPSLRGRPGCHKAFFEQIIFSLWETSPVCFSVPICVQRAVYLSARGLAVWPWDRKGGCDTVSGGPRPILSQNVAAAVAAAASATTWHRWCVPDTLHPDSVLTGNGHTVGQSRPEQLPL